MLALSRLRTLGGVSDDDTERGSLGGRIRQARNAAGISQSDLARLVGVESQTISLYEREKIGDPRMHTVAAIAAALRVRVDWLVRGTEVDDSRVEFDHVDTPAWLELVALGWLERYKRRGLSDAQIEYARRTLFRGVPTVDDYVDVLEAMVSALRRGGSPERPEAPEMAGARAKSERDGTPKAKHRVPVPPVDEPPRRRGSKSRS